MFPVRLRLMGTFSFDLFANQLFIGLSVVWTVRVSMVLCVIKLSFYGIVLIESLICWQVKFLVIYGNNIKFITTYFSIFWGNLISLRGLFLTLWDLCKRCWTEKCIIKSPRHFLQSEVRTPYMTPVSRINPSFQQKIIDKNGD
jgi:hypothetical protein